jgi:hypothetical protein
LLGHDSLVQLAGLLIIAQFALVEIVALSTNHIIAHCIWRFGGVRAELMFEAVWHVLRIASVVCIVALLTVKI